MKVCRRCSIEKPLTSFYKDVRYEKGVKGRCIECYNIGRAAYSKEYASKNKDIISIKHKIYHQKNKDRVNAKHREWVENNTGRVREYEKAYRSKRMATDISYRIKANLRSKLSFEIKGATKHGRMLEFLGCSVGDLKKYLESKFKDGMSWENYGLKGWHIDHIKPCSLYDLSDPEQQKECFHYTNLQPLWAKENIKKSNKYEQ